MVSNPGKIDLQHRNFNPNPLANKKAQKSKWLEVEQDKIFNGP